MSKAHKLNLRQSARVDDEWYFLLSQEIQRIREKTGLYINYISLLGQLVQNKARKC